MKHRNMVEPLRDEQIVELYWRRDENAIRETDRKYKHYLLSIAQSIVGNEGDSEECLNDTYLKAWDAIPPERPRVLQAFLAIIMRRTAVDRVRTERRQKRIPTELTASLSELEALTAGGTTPSEEQDAHEISRTVNAYLRTLSDRRLYIFTKRYYFSQPIAQIADTLQVSKSTVKQELVTIKSGLREALEKEGYTV